MTKLDTQRDNLLNVFNKLSDDARDLVRLCAIIDEPLALHDLLAIVRKSSLNAELETAELLRNLVQLGLLDARYEVHDSIQEIVVRRAAAVGFIRRASELLAGMDSFDSWIDGAVAETACAACGAAVRDKALVTPIGPLCIACVLLESRTIAALQDVSAWNDRDVFSALSAENGIAAQLTTIWRFPDLLRSRSIVNIFDLMPLLVQNMGFTEPHPLALSVRKAALRSCTLVGKPVVTALLKVKRKEKWQLKANIVTALANIAPENIQARLLFRDAAFDAAPETRRSVATALSRLPFPWIYDIIKELAYDTDPEIKELAGRYVRAAHAKRTGHFSPSSPVQITMQDERNIAPVRFGLYVRGICETHPMEVVLSPQSDRTSARLVRDLRIAVHGRDSDLFWECSSRLSSKQSKFNEHLPALLRIFNSPFDRDWFDSLPGEMQLFALTHTVSQAVNHLESDVGMLAWAMDGSRMEKANPEEKRTIFFQLASRLILGGKIADARPLIAKMDSAGFSGGLLGTILFIEGETQEALSSFDAELPELRRRGRNKNALFEGVCGIFHILALLASSVNADIQKAELLLQNGLTRSKDTPWRLGSFWSLQGILHMLRFEQNEARTTISKTAQMYAKTPLSILVNAIAEIWVNGTLSAGSVTAVARTYHEAADIGMAWIAMESAALLIRTGRNTIEHHDFIDNILKKTDMQSFVMTINIEEPWQKNLRALIHLKEPEESPSAQVNVQENRMIWFVVSSPGKLLPHAAEQKRLRSGAWSKPRPITMGRLYAREKIDFATPQDLAICNAIVSEDRFYFGDYRWNTETLLPAMIGHPLVFLKTDPPIPVEIVKGEPEIMVLRNASMLHIKSTVALDNSHVMLIEESCNRFKVIQLTEEHRRIGRILGKEGIKAPANAINEVLEAIASMTSFVVVHSEIGGSSDHFDEIDADPTPRVHLTPSGRGFTAEIFVAPFGVKGTPILKPGIGATRIIADVKGRRTMTQRDMKVEEQMASAIEDASPTFARLSDGARRAFIDDAEDCLQILLDLKDLQEENRAVVEWPEGEKLKVTRAMSSGDLKLRIGSDRDWFAMSGSLQVDEELTIDIKKLLELLQYSGRRFIPLEDGTFLALTKEFRKRLDEIDFYTNKEGKELRLHPLAAMAMQDIAEEITHLTVDDRWMERVARIRAAGETTPAVPATLRAELRDYQEEGYRWLARLSGMGVGACLADDMGLGKTMQTLALLLHRASLGPSLVIAPTSVCWNWEAEAARFAPSLNVVQFFGGNREEIIRNLGHNDVLIASYGLLVLEEERLSPIDWNVVVLDEAQSIKNVATKRFQAAMRLKADFRMVATGTPIQNHLDELWALFSFINPGLLGSPQQFNTRFAVPIEKYNNRDIRSRLKRLIQPFILRRLKSQVLDELPPRTEIVLQVEMSREETAFYEALRRQAIERIEADSAPVYVKQLKILAEITRLRQAACNPRLILPDTTLGSAKLALFGDIVEELLENRHRALVFSQFVRHLDLIREYLDGRKIGYRYLDGSTPQKDRQKEVDAFQAGNGDLFLISLKAGGLGLNLTAADYVIHMDPWWNPSVEDQASDRAHRIGQRQPVTVYRLVVKDTIEEKIVKLHHEKRELAGNLLDGTDISGAISAEELIRLIQEG